MRYRTSTPNERVWCITQLAKLSFNHSIGRTHSWRSSIFYKISLSVCLSVCLSMCVRVTFVVFIDCESCTRLISTNPGSMEAGEHALTRGTCFLACHLELDAVTRMLWILWCVLGGANFFVFFCWVFFLRTHTACCKYEATLPHLPLYW